MEKRFYRGASLLKRGTCLPLNQARGGLDPTPSCAPENMFNLSSFRDNREKRENI